MFIRKVSVGVLRDYEGNKQECEHITTLTRDPGAGEEEIIKYKTSLTVIQ